MKKTVRDEYNELLHELRFNKDRENDEKYLDEILNKTDVLFEKVDDINLLKIDAKIRSEGTRLSKQSLEKQIKGGYSVMDFIKFIGKDGFDNFCTDISRDYIGIDFYTPCSLVPKESISRKRSERLQDSTAVVPSKMEIINEDEAVANIDKIVASITDSVGFYNLVLDPHDFAKTIENIFYTAFAVKLGRLNLRKGQSGEILVTKESDKSDYSNEEGHLIFDIEYDEYKKLIEKLEIKDAFIKRT